MQEAYPGPFRLLKELYSKNPTLLEAYRKDDRGDGTGRQTVEQNKQQGIRKPLISKGFAHDALLKLSSWYTSFHEQHNHQAHTSTTASVLLSVGRYFNRLSFTFTRRYYTICLVQKHLWLAVWWVSHEVNVSFKTC